MSFPSPIDRRTVLKLAGVLSGWPSLGAAQAPSAYPARQVSLVVGFAPGGSTDFVGREIAQRLTDVLGKPVVVENRPGANGLLAAAGVAAAPPDGHTLFLASMGLTTNPHLYSKNRLHPVKDFTSISLLVSVPNVLVVNAQLPVTNLDEFLRHARAAKKPLTSATTGQAAPGHLASELLKRDAKIALEFIAYKGSAPALNDVAAGHVDMSMPTLLAALPLIRSGRIRPIALTGAHRSDLVPGVPTLGEGGFKELDAAAGWYGLFGPAGMPKPIVDRLNAEVVSFMKQPDVRQRFVANGADPVGLGAAETEAYVAQDYKRWADLVKVAGIKGEE